MQRWNASDPGCPQCNAGFFDIRQNTVGARYSFSNPVFTGTIGKVRGGTFNGSILARMPPAGTCYESSAAQNRIYLDSTFTAGDQPLNGELKINGRMCLNQLGKGANIGSFRIDAVLSEYTPGFLQADSLQTGINPPVWGADTVSSIDGFQVHIQASPHIDAANMTYSDFFDTTLRSSLTAGTDFAVVDLGNDGFFYTDGTTDNETKVSRWELLANVSGAEWTDTGPNGVLYPTDPDDEVCNNAACDEWRITETGLVELGYLLVEDSTTFVSFNDTDFDDGTVEAFVESRAIADDEGRISLAVEDGTPGSYSTGLLIAGSGGTATVRMPEFDCSSGFLTTDSLGFLGCGTATSGSVALGTAPILARDCAPVVTAPAVGLTASSAFTLTPQADLSLINGYNPANPSLTIAGWPTVDQINVRVCNVTDSQVTPGALSLNWEVR